MLKRRCLLPEGKCLTAGESEFKGVLCAIGAEMLSCLSKELDSQHTDLRSNLTLLWFQVLVLKAERICGWGKESGESLGHAYLFSAIGNYS